MSARTKEANIPSSRANKLSGVSYSKIFPRFITITRSAVRMVWTRCCEWKEYVICYKLQGTVQEKWYTHAFYRLFKDTGLSWHTRGCRKHSLSFFSYLENHLFIYFKILANLAGFYLDCINFNVVNTLVPLFFWNLKASKCSSNNSMLKNHGRSAVLYFIIVSFARQLMRWISTQLENLSKEMTSKKTIRVSPFWHATL